MNLGWPPHYDGRPADVPETWPSPNNPMAVARRYLENYTLDSSPLLRSWRGAWMRWETTHWAEADDATVRSELYAALEHATWDGTKGGKPAVVPWQPNRNRIANALDALAAITHLPETVSPPAWLARDGTRSGPMRDQLSNQIVSCENGLLDVDSRELMPHGPAFFNVVSVPFAYQPGATAPKWQKFLSELWPDDPDSVTALQQFIGYLLSGRTDIHKILLVIGPTRAGKGTIGRILAKLLGADNVASPTLAALSSNFGLAPLIGKPLAVVSDARLSGSSFQVVERLLSISGEDPMTIDRKYREPWTGQLPTRFVVMSNELPSFGDASGAIAHRFAVLVLKRSWLGSENTALTGELAAELPGILNWALDGLTSLARQGHFTEPKSSVDAAISLLDQASPTSAFVRDCCDVTAAGEVAVDDLYAAWKAWCEDNGRDKPGTKQIFGRNLNAAVPGLVKVQPRDGEARYRGYTGIRIKEPVARDGTRSPLLQDQLTRATPDSRIEPTHPSTPRNGFERVPSRASLRTITCPTCETSIETTVEPGEPAYCKHCDAEYIAA